MRWLLHGNLTAAVAENLRKREDHPTSLADVGLAPNAPAAEVLKLAHTKQLDLMTTEPTLAEAPYALDFWFGRSIVHLAVDAGDVEQDDAVDRLFARYKHLTPGRLYIVTNSRVKIRQLPSRR
jgi:hypothetical protein